MDAYTQFDEESTRGAIARQELELRSYSFYRPFILIGMISVPVLCIFAVLAGKTDMLFWEINSKSSSTYLSTKINDISLSVASPGYPAIDAINDLPWDTLAEPYKNQIITAKSMTTADSLAITIDNSYDVYWKIAGMSFKGRSANFMLKSSPTVLYDCSVAVYQDGIKVASKTFSMAVKYVRREIRSLTDEDRNVFLDTLQVLYTTSQEKGEAKYGEKFVSAATLLAKHLDGAGRTDCDHWHDGAGIVVHHMAYTLFAEQSLQAINPAVSMPYWEYAKDAYLYDNWWESDIFNDDWFGAASPLTADHSIQTGRWGGLEMPDGKAYLEWDISAEGSLNPFVNARGVMRSPWNNNPSKFVGRHNMTYDYTSTTMPDCELMQACYKSRSLASINDCLNGVTHGPVHILIGGAWGEGDMFKTNHDISFLQGINKPLFFKNLWRTGFARCPTSCPPEEQCMCSIPDEYLKQYSAKQILELAGVWENMADSFHSTYDDDSDKYLAALLAVSDPAIVGDMYTSAASFDPSFWPVHGQIERIVALKRVGISQGVVTDFDETWGFDAKNTRYLQGICDWSAVKSPEDLTLPTCSMSTTAVCPGHGEDDELDFGNFLGTGDTYTNKDFYDFLHPWNDDLPYTYDTFRFDYCDDTDYPFTEKTKNAKEPKSDLGVAKTSKKASKTTHSNSYSSGMGR